MHSACVLAITQFWRRWTDHCQVVTAGKWREPPTPHVNHWSSCLDKAGQGPEVCQANPPGKTQWFSLSCLAGVRFWRRWKIHEA
jgi:hypothetical protein